MAARSAALGGAPVGLCVTQETCQLIRRGRWIEGDHHEVSGQPTQQPAQVVDAAGSYDG